MVFSIHDLAGEKDSTVEVEIRHFAQDDGSKKKKALTLDEASGPFE